MLAYIIKLLYYFVLAVTIILPIIICVAFFTLLERKVLASIQRRRGPNMVGFWGFLQPFADALKSIFKEISIPSGCDYYLFFFAPVYTLVLSLMPWAIIPFSSNFVFADINLGVLFILLVSSLNVYGIILAGWSSNSKYSLLGAIRAAAQMISYEIPLSLTVVPVIMAAGSMNLTDIVVSQRYVWFALPFLPCFMIFMVSMLAETNRTPFDLPEAEAEIVAGYNVEYSSIFFAMFFLAEYGNIMVISSFGVILFLGGWLLPFGLSDAIFSHKDFLERGFFAMKVVLMMLFFIVVRAVCPRYRYDQLMDINWKMFLPFVLSYIFFAATLFVFINILATSVDPISGGDLAKLSLFLIPSGDVFDVFFSGITFFDQFTSLFVFDGSSLADCYTSYYRQRRYSIAELFLIWLYGAIKKHSWVFIYLLLFIIFIDVAEKWWFARQKEKLIGRRISVNYIEYYEYYISSGIYTEKKDPNAKISESKNLKFKFFAACAAIKFEFVEAMKAARKTFMIVMYGRGEDVLPAQSVGSEIVAEKPAEPQVTPESTEVKPEIKNESSAADKTKTAVALGFAHRQELTPDLLNRDCLHTDLIFYPEFVSDLLNRGCFLNSAFIFFCVVLGCIVFDEWRSLISGVLNRNRPSTAGFVRRAEEAPKAETPASKEGEPKKEIPSKEELLKKKNELEKLAAEVAELEKSSAASKEELLKKKKELERLEKERNLAEQQAAAARSHWLKSVSLTVLTAVVLDVVFCFIFIKVKNG